MRGEIEYTIFDGKNDLPLQWRRKNIGGESHQRNDLLGLRCRREDGTCLSERRNSGFIKRNGQSERRSGQDPLLNRLFLIDSLPSETKELIVRKIKSLGSDMDKTRFLNQITPAQFNNPSIAVPLVLTSSKEWVLIWIK